MGKNHPEVAQSLNNLARLYHDIGDYTNAESFYREDLDIRKSSLGQNHPEVAQSLNNLARLYSDLGNYSKAEPLFREALDIWNSSSGEKFQHPCIPEPQL